MCFKTNQLKATNKLKNKPKHLNNFCKPEIDELKKITILERKSLNCRNKGIS